MKLSHIGVDLAKISSSCTGLTSTARSSGGAGGAATAGYGCCWMRWSPGA